MLGTEEIRREVAKVVYRPGWSFEVYEIGFEDPWLLVLAPVENSYVPGQTIDLGIRSPMPPMADAEAVHRWLMWRLERIESHEAREFYRVRGERPFDPHREV